VISLSHFGYTITV